MCEPESRGPSLLTVAGIVAGALAGAAVVKAAAAMLSVAEAIGVTVLAACALGAVAAVVFVARHGGFGIIVKREVINHTVIRAALRAPRRAVEAPGRVVEGVIIEKEAVR